jgi:hypothetical protein
MAVAEGFSCIRLVRVSRPNRAALKLQRHTRMMRSGEKLHSSKWRNFTNMAFDPSGTLLAATGSWYSAGTAALQVRGVQLHRCLNASGPNTPDV